MAGKNNKPQLPLTEINYLPPVQKTNQEIELDFIGPIRFKHWRFYILLSIDRYSRWPAACFCEAPTGRTAKKFMERYDTLNGLTRTISKALPLKEKNLKNSVNPKHQSNIWDTLYTHTNRTGENGY